MRNVFIIQIVCTNSSRSYVFEYVRKEFNFEANKLKNSINVENVFVRSDSFQPISASRSNEATQKLIFQNELAFAYNTLIL